MLFANNCNTTLSSSITNVATTMSVTSATGFPAPTGSQYFYCTLADAATQTTIEIVKVTAVSGTTFTIVRGQDGTTGTIFASGAVVSLRLVAASLNDFPKLDEANTFTTAQTFSSAPITSTLTGFVYGNGASAQTVATTAQALSLIGTLPVANGGTGVTSSTGTSKTVLSSLPSFDTTIGIGAATASASGSGITFPATQSASTNANTLDDYEEGTFYYLLSDGTNNSGGPFAGIYTKIGRTVTVSFSLYSTNVTALTATSGQLRITGLPFNSVIDQCFASGNIWADQSGLNYFSVLTGTSIFFNRAFNTTDILIVTMSSLGTPTTMSLFGSYTYQSS